MLISLFHRRPNTFFLRRIPHPCPRLLSLPIYLPTFLGSIWLSSEGIYTCDGHLTANGLRVEANKMMYCHMCVVSSRTELWEGIDWFAASRTKTKKRFDININRITRARCCLASSVQETSCKNTFSRCVTPNGNEKWQRRSESRKNDAEWS